MEYVETNCTITHDGRTYEAGGAHVTPRHCIAYLGPNGELHDWHGNTIGRYRITAAWKLPNSPLSTTMHQVEATVDGITYTGRSLGEGMVYSGKPKRGW